MNLISIKNFVSRCPYVSGPPSCNIVQGDYQAPYPSCCPRVECPSENTVNDDQLMLAAKPGLFATYDVTLNDEVSNFRDL